MAAVALRALQLDQADDPAEVIRKRVADTIDDIEIGGEDLLIGVYIPNKDAKTRGGLLLPDSYRDEFKWQGITGLVLKVGPLAYNTEKTENWYRKPPQVGDWVMCDVKTSHPFYLGEQMCRFVAAQYVLAKVARPTLVL